jgi:AraC-like DNA-binding protein
MSAMHALGAQLASHRPAPLHTIIIAVRVLEQQGYAVTDLLLGSGITVSDLARPDLVVSHAQELIVFANALRITQDEATGITIGRAIPVTAYGIRGHAMLVSPTLGDALRLGFSFPLLAIAYFRFALHEVGEDAVMTISDYRYRSDLRIFNTAMCVAAIQREVIDLLGSVPEFKRITFDFPAPENAERFSQLLQCEVVFDAASTSVVLPARYLPTPLAYFHEIEYELARHLCRQREQELSVWTPDQVVTRALQHLHGHDGILGAQALAQKLGTSHRAMQRELERAGVSYRRLLDEVRQARALEYRANLPAGSVKMLARDLGYGSSFALKRAQARWSKK